MISHHVNSPTPTQYVTTLLTKPGVTAASVYHKRRRFLPALEPFLLQSSIAFTVQALAKLEPSLLAVVLLQLSKAESVKY